MLLQATSSQLRGACAAGTLATVLDDDRARKSLVLEGSPWGCTVLLCVTVAVRYQFQLYCR